MQYRMSETPIKDKSVLGTQGEKLCEAVDVYWLTPTIDDGGDDGDRPNADDDDGDDDAGKPTVCRNL